MSIEQTQVEPEPPYQVIVTFNSAMTQRAFYDWVASGEATSTLWMWMGRHGYIA